MTLLRAIDSSGQPTVGWVVPASSKAKPPPETSIRPVFGAIPARYASTRLPGKPLRLLAGRPLIEHVYRRAQEVKSLDRVVVLTDDERIGQAVSDFGGEFEMTPEGCASGTDRIAYAAQSWDAAAVVNIQGDEPLIEPEAIEKVAVHLRANTDDPMVTLATPTTSNDPENPDVVKVVVGLQGQALYFSRSPIPNLRNAAGASSLRHIGIYGYQREALMLLAQLEPSPLEIRESLEQLRALENGISIRVLTVEHAWQGVDTIQDLEQV